MTANVFKYHRAGLWRPLLIGAGRCYAITSPKAGGQDQSLVRANSYSIERKLVSLGTSDCSVTVMEDARSSVATLESYKPKLSK
jgi:hypothetical protein